MSAKTNILLLSCALWAAPLVSSAESNPKAISIRLQCHLKDESGAAEKNVRRRCQLLNGWFQGRLDWRSGGTVGDDTSGSLLFSEFGLFYAVPLGTGEVVVYADGNGSAEDFERWYLQPGSDNVLTAPDLRTVLYVEKQGEYLMYSDQRFMPTASALWAKQAEEALHFSGELAGDVTGTQGATWLRALQGVPLSSTAPGAGQSLRFNGRQWAPATAAPLTAGSGLQGGSYDTGGPATFSVVFGTGAGTVTEGSDVRLPPAPGAAGQLLYSTGSSWAALSSSGSSTQVLHGGETPSWGPVSLGADVSGVLPVAHGGTGLASPGAAGQVLRSTGSGWVSAPLSGSDVPSGSGHYIQNQSGSAQNARMWISGPASVGSLQVGGGTALQRVQMGTVSLSAPGKCHGYPIMKCNYAYSISFPRAFSSVPALILMPRSSCHDCGDTFHLTTRNVTASGFELIVTRSDPYHHGEDWGQTLRIDFMASN